MEGIYNITWSPKAKITYYDVLEYLEENWTVKELAAFIHRTEQVIKHIQNSPTIYPYSSLSKSYKCVIVKQVSLFYQVTPTEIKLLIFWDNRKNPSALKIR